MSVYDFLVDFAIASALILVGQFLRAKIKFFQEFFIPASMLAGFIGLLLGERFLNVVHFSSGASSYAGALIIVVFTVVGLNGFSKGRRAALTARSSGCSALPCTGTSSCSSSLPWGSR